MTDPAAADKRRAVAMVCHYGNSDAAGMDAILREAHDNHRVGPLITSVLDLHQDVVPQLLTSVGMACISDFVIGLANHGADADTRRAAALIAHHGNNNTDAVDALLADARDQGTELIMAVLSIYSTVLPMLYCPMGIRLLEPSAARWRGEER